MTTPTVRANHYPLKPLYRSRYRPGTGALAQLPRHVRLVMDNHENIIFHAGDAMPSDYLIGGERLDGAAAVDAYHQHVAHLLHKAGLIRVTRRSHEYLYASWYQEIKLNQGVGIGAVQYAPKIRGHYRWTWDVEKYDGRYWLVPLLGLRFISAASLDDGPFASWVRKELWGEKVTAIPLITGALQTVLWEEDHWCFQQAGGRQPLGKGPWHITFDMYQLKKLHRSEDAFHQAENRAHALLKDVSTYPFADLLQSHTTKVLQPTETNWIGGNHLRFGKRTGQQMKEVYSHGLRVPPSRPVKLLFCVPENKRTAIRDYLLYHFWRATPDLKSRLAMPDADTVGVVWSNKWKLPPFIFHHSILTYANDGSLNQPETITQVATEADKEGVQLVIVLVLPDEEMSSAFMDRIHAHFRGAAPVVQFMAKTLTSQGLSNTDCFATWGSVALKIATKVGAVAWELCDIPGVDERTVFLGLDLGHNHQMRHSRLAITLVDHKGLPLLSRPRVLNLQHLNERLPGAAELHREFRKLLRQAGREQPSQVIVHRDGRYLDTEAEDLCSALSFVPRVSLVAIKKDAKTRLDPPSSGIHWRLSDRRALLLTNVQHGSAVPIEVELCHQGALTIDVAGEQVFWLTRAYQGDAFQAPKLPITTRLANNTAGTGHAVHLSHWMKGPRP